MVLLIIVLGSGLIYLMLKVLISGAEKVKRDADSAKDDAYYNDPDIEKKYLLRAIALGMNDENQDKIVYWENGNTPFEMYLWRSYDYLYMFPTGHISPYLRKPKKANEVKEIMIPLDKVKLKRSAQLCLFEGDEKSWYFDLSDYTRLKSILDEYQEEQDE